MTPRRLSTRSAHVRPLPGPPPRAPLRAPRRRGRDLGQARGLQLGPRLRRQQGAQARVSRRRRARAGLRHARLDRRRPVEPHPAGRGGRSSPRSRLPARPGALGRLGRPRLRQGRQHPPLADHGRRRAALGRRLRHRLPGELGGGPGRGRPPRGGKPYPIPAGASDHPLGGHGFARWADEVADQEAELGLFFDTIVVCSVTGLDAGGHDRGLRRAGSASARFSGSTARRRYSRRGIRSRGSPAARRNRSGSRVRSPTTRSSSSTNGTPAPTASPTRRRSRRSDCVPGWRGCSPTPSTRGSRWQR